MGRYSRAKGLRGEQEAVRLLHSLGVRCHRASFGQQAGGLPDIVNELGLEVEVKRTEKAKVGEWVDWLSDLASRGKTGFVLWRSNRRPWVAIMLAADLPVIGSRFAQMGAKSHESEVGVAADGIADVSDWGGAGDGRGR